MTDVLYFGCWGHSGHYLYSTYGETVPSGAIEIDAQALDGKYAPRYGRAEAPEGDAALVYVRGWTVLAFWDRSVDRRGGSNSAFCVRGAHGFDATVAIAREKFPQIWKRFSFTVRLTVEPSGMPAEAMLSLADKAAAYSAMRDELERWRTGDCSLRHPTTDPRAPALHVWGLDDSGVFHPPCRIACDQYLAPALDELAELRAERDRALRLGYELTLDCQSLEEMVTELVRLVRQARAERDGAGS